MAKYIAKKFAPIVYQDWVEIFHTMTTEQRSEVLIAIASFPNYEPKDVALWGFFKSQLQNQYDVWLERSEIYRSNGKVKKAKDALGSNSQQLLPNANNSQLQSPIATNSNQQLAIVRKPEPIPESKKEVEEKRTNTHELTLTVIPERWKELCSANRPDLDAVKLFNSFRFYWTEGAGSAKRERFKSDRGWNQAWSNWIDREKHGTGTYQEPSQPKRLSKDDPHYGLTEEQIQKRLEGSRRYHERIMKWEAEQKAKNTQITDEPPDWFIEDLKGMANA